MNTIVQQSISKEPDEICEKNINSNLQNKPIFTNVHNIVKKRLPKNSNIVIKKCEIDSLSGDESDQYNNDQQNNNETYMVLDIQDVIKSIPSDAVKTPSPKLQQTHTEWRWRFLVLKDRKLVEISKMAPGSNRIYMNNKGIWTPYSLKKGWDDFVVDAKYCYVKSI